MFRHGYKNTSRYPLLSENHIHKWEAHSTTRQQREVYAIFLLCSGTAHLLVRMRPISQILTKLQDYEPLTPIITATLLTIVHFIVPSVSIKRFQIQSDRHALSVSFASQIAFFSYWLYWDSVLSLPYSLLLTKENFSQSTYLIAFCICMAWSQDSE